MRVYILFIRVSRNVKIMVGNLGRIAFKKGTCLYIGRAKTNLATRIARHYRRKKRLFWHIDYFLSRKGTEIKEAWAGSGLKECKLAQKISLLPSSRLIRSFGSSGCRCPGHLFYTTREREVKTLLKELNFEKYVIGKVMGVCRSKRKEKPKKNVRRGYLKKGFGLVGDAHFGTEKEVSLLAIEDACPVRSPQQSWGRRPRRLTSNGVKKKLPFPFRPGNFAENITTQGINLTSLPIRTRLKVGKAILKVSQIGKGKGIHTYSYRGYSLLPKYGVFCKVIKSGWVKIRDRIEVIRK